MVSSKIEFAVEMTCEKCVKQIEENLQGLKGVQKYDVSLQGGVVIVQTTLPAVDIQKCIEKTGRRAVLKGYGGLTENKGAAVAMLGKEVGAASDLIKGVVRFAQVDDENCVIDGTIDGLSPGLHGLHVHEFGDISRGCESVGNHFNPRTTRHGSPENSAEERHAGDLGNIMSDESGRATFRLTDKVLKVSDIIGRSVVVTENADDLGHGDQPSSFIDGNSGRRLACGIIAQSAGLFENVKKYCACDGVTLWDERDKPLTGPGRSSSNVTANL